jgi:hypothetical protein
VSVLHVLVQMLYLEEKNLAVESRQKTFEIQEQGYAIMEGLTGQHRDSPRE